MDSMWSAQASVFLSRVNIKVGKQASGVCVCLKIYSFLICSSIDCMNKLDGDLKLVSY